MASIDQPPGVDYRLSFWPPSWVEWLDPRCRALAVIGGISGAEGPLPEWFACPECGIVLSWWRLRARVWATAGPDQQCRHAQDSVRQFLNVGAFVEAGLVALHAS